MRGQRLHPDNERSPDRHRDRWRRDRHGRTHVAPGELDHLVLTPASDSPTAGTDVTYEAEGFDAYGNSRGDVTDDTTFDDGC